MELNMKTVTIIAFLIFSLSSFAKTENRAHIFCKDSDRTHMPYYQFQIDIDLKTRLATVQVFEQPYYGAKSLPLIYKLRGFEQALFEVEKQGLYIEGATDGDAGYARLIPGEKESNYEGDLIFPESGPLHINGEPLHDGAFLNLNCRAFGV
jgi:hypothetical protein